MIQPNLKALSLFYINFYVKEMAALLIYVLTKGIKHGNAFFFNAMTKEGNILEGRIFGKNEEDQDKLSLKMRPRSFVLIQKYSLSNNDTSIYLKLTAGTSKVFQTGSSFILDDEKVNSFFHSPVCTVPEAASSPKKRRVSIQGKIAQVFDIKEGSTWCRRDVYLEDQPTAKKICVKLWDDHAHKINKTHVSQNVTIENVEVDVYQEKHQLKSTDLTNVVIEEVNPDVTFAGEYSIVGIDKEGETYTMMLQDEREIQLPRNILEEIDISFENFMQMTPITANISVENNTVSRLVLPAHATTN